MIIIVLALQLSAAEGSTRISLKREGLSKDLCQIFNCASEKQVSLDRMLCCLIKAGQGSINPSIAALVGQPGDYRPLIADRGWLSIQKLHVLENRVAEMFARRLANPVTEKPDLATDSALKKVLNRPPRGADGQAACLDPEQIRALKIALQRPLAVISGRPGTGKTSIITSLVRILVRTGMKTENIALAAPTGKAADRMRQSIVSQLERIDNPDQEDQNLKVVPPAASTMHRLLGYSPKLDRFRHNENNLLNEELVIVDESSMLDLFLIDSLLRALKDNTHLILLGDADQLPSIEAGAVLRDLCRSQKATASGRISVLQKSYRARADNPAGQAILNLAEAINRGVNIINPDRTNLLSEKKQADQLTFLGTELLISESNEDRKNLYSRWLAKILKELPDLFGMINREYRYEPEGFDPAAIKNLKLLFSHYERFRMLCVTRLPAGGTGAEPVNQWFHQRWQSVLESDNQPILWNQFYSGEPVMINRNDYRLHLYNGDSGLILNVATENDKNQSYRTLMAVFPNGDTFSAYPLALMRGRVELAWATTVHKAQGSEYDHIALILPDQPVRPLTRELLYTAVTRAKKSVLINGSRQILQDGINRTFDRASGLTELLT